MGKMITVAFDPGLTTGWAVFDDGKLVNKGQTKFLELLTELDGLPVPNLVVYEDFQLLPHKAKAQIGSKFETIQAIGMIKAYAHKHKCGVVVQRPGVKKIAEKWTGVRPPKNHAQSHWVDAFNHGAYHLIKNGLMQSLLEEQGGKP